MKKSSLKRIALGVLVGMALLVGLVWLLILTLGNKPAYVFAGKSIEDWRAQLNSHNPGTSNDAFAVVSSRVIPEITATLFSDTNDSRLRVSLVQTLNQLPSVQIYFADAAGRRIDAAQNIAELGPGAKTAVPALIQALKGSDAVVRGPAITALGEIHSDPDTVIPLLITYLDDDNLNDEAAKALAHYGSLAKAAVPKILPMLHAPDKDARAAAVEALQKIDPEAYTNATKRVPGGVTNGVSLTR
jgi:hypothetical protein